MTGFPVEQVRQLVSAETTRAADAVLEARVETDAAAQLLDQGCLDLGRDGRELRRRIRLRRKVSDVAPERVRSLAAGYDAALERQAYAHASFETIHAAESATVERRLDALVHQEDFRHVLLLSSPGLDRRLLDHEPRNASKRRERTASRAAYLQRLTTKNETISFFGPSAWGRASPDLSGAVDVVLGSTLDRRVRIERWVCEELLQRIAADVEPAAAPANPGALPATLPSVPDPLGWLESEVRARSQGAAGARWLARLQDLARVGQDIQRADRLAAREVAMRRLSTLLEQCGVAVHREGAELYASRLPFVEDCLRQTERCTVGGPLVEQLEVDLAPWYELWRDLAGAYGAALLELLREVLAEASRGGPVALPEFLAAAAKAGIPLGKTGGVGIPRRLEHEIQQAWEAQLGDRSTLPEVTLEAGDFGFLRRRFPIRRLRGYFGWPAPDVQIAAEGPQALRAGRFLAVLSEIHPSMTMWNLGRLQFCPDLAALTEQFSSGAIPALSYGAGNHFQGSVHMLLMAPRHLPDWCFTGAAHMPDVRRIAPEEVFVRAEDDDLFACDASGTRLGSLIDNWLVASSTHRLELLGSGPHSPRLRVGRVIVQRRSWRVDSARVFPSDRPVGGAAGFFAWRALARDLGLPDEVFARPMLPIHGTHHPDAKPVFADLRSPLLVELLTRMARKYRELGFVEMLPRTDECWLADTRGHYTCELRMFARPEAPAEEGAPR